MQQKKLPILIIISILILSCSSPSDPNNDNSSGNNNNNNVNNNTKGFTANGIPTTYDGIWKFYNVDETGNKAVDVTISGGSISGLVISNKATTKDFDKSTIYSESGTSYANIYYGGYKGYIVSDGDWIGEIQLPAQSSTGIGYVSIKNNSTQELIEGILDSAGTKRGEDLGSVNDIKGTWTSGTKKLEISKDFLIYYDNNQQQLKIPFMFFSSFSGYGGTGYEIKGLIYDGININTTTVTTKGNILFQYIENNHHLNIEIGADGVPTKAEYINKSETILSSTEFVKQ